MGAAACCQRIDIESSPKLQQEWKIWSNTSDKSRTATYSLDSTLPIITNPDEILLLDLLKEPLGQAAIGRYAKDVEKMELLMCWIDIEEYKHIKTDDLRQQSAVMLCKKYILRNIFSAPAVSVAAEDRAINSLSLLEVTNLVEAMGFINKGIDEHSFAPVRHIISINA
jgi:hypothetical protein